MSRWLRWMGAFALGYLSVSAGCKEDVCPEVESAEYDGTYTAEALGNAQALIDVVFEARQVKVHFASDDDVVEIVYDAELHQP